MAFESLSDREKKVLACLISYYVKSADPVGSRIIANKFRLGLSSATIRNTMQDLEELGLVQQPHTSAGRIPTDAGYRLFVDFLLHQEPLTEHERKVIEESITSRAGGVDSILEQTSRVLADLSNHLGVSVSPKIDESILSHVDLVQMAEGKVLPYLDIPFQHASPEVLKRMKRPAAQEKTLERIERWRRNKRTGQREHRVVYGITSLSPQQADARRLAQMSGALEPDQPQASGPAGRGPGAEPQLHPGETLVEPWIGAQAVPLRRNCEMDQPRIAYVEGALEKLEGLVEVSHLGGTQQRPDHGVATV